MTEPNQKLHQQSQQRERGTLKETLPRKPIIIIFLVCLVSALLATLLVVYSLVAPPSNGGGIDATVDKEMWWTFFGISMLGSASTLVGIIYGDSLSHAFAFGVVVLLSQLVSAKSNVDQSFLKSSITAASPPLILSTLASSKWLRSIFSFLDKCLFSNNINLIMTPLLALLASLSVMSPQITTTMLMGIGDTTKSEILSITPICFISILTLVLFMGYNKNRSHKNGYLFAANMKSHAVLSTISIVYSSILLIGERKDNEAVMIIILLHAGSLFTLLITYLFASIGDVWYVVGSGQFQMVSLDTMGMMFYFIFPVVILFFRFEGLYGEVARSAAEVAKGYLHSILGVQSNGDTVYSSLVLALALITSIGVSLLNALCPMGGYLFSRAYTHGQPNTKKVALCIDFSDLPHGESYLLKFLKEMKMDAVFNIFVSREDIALFHPQLKELIKKGHNLVLSPTNYKWNISGLNLLKGKLAASNIQSAYDIYSGVLGKNPSWFFAKSADGIGRHPALFQKARELGMKVAYWSTLIEVDGWNLTAEQLSDLKNDVIDKNGGSIIYVTLGKKGRASAGGLTSSSICQIVDGLTGHDDANYSFESLSDVVQDDATMVL